MTQQTEQALTTIKRLCDLAIQRGGVFSTIESVIDIANAYNYIVSLCDKSEHIEKSPIPKEEFNGILQKEPS